MIRNKLIFLHYTRPTPEETLDENEEYGIRFATENLYCIWRELIHLEIHAVSIGVGYKSTPEWYL